MSNRIMYIITAMMLRLLKDFGDKQRMQIGECVDDFIEQIHESESRGSTPAQTAKGLQQAADDMLDEAKLTNPEWKNVTCRKGCAHCCRMTVAISGHEAQQLLQVSRAKGLMIDTDRLKRQSSYGDKTWRLQPEADRNCAFLGEDNLCQVYDDRPLSCRKYFVVSPPEHCDTVKFPSQPTLVFVDAASEMLTTAAFTHADCGFMPSMLLEAMAKEAKHVK